MKLVKINGMWIFTVLVNGCVVQCIGRTPRQVFQIAESIDGEVSDLHKDSQRSYVHV
jgi:hypothetical protein